jgi:uncharacterized protein (DUF4415 family)
MNAKRSGSARLSPEADSLPEVTEAWISGAELRRADTLVRRGRPELDDRRKLLSLRLPPAVLSKWNASGPGWQTRMAAVLENSAPKGRRTAG